MQRLLAPAPAVWTGLSYPDAIAINEVDVDGVPYVAAYFDDDAQITDAEWVSYVTAFTPTDPVASGPSLDDIAATIQASPDLPTEVKDALLAVITTVQTSMSPLGAT